MSGIRARIRELVESSTEHSSRRAFSLAAGLAKGHVNDIIEGRMEPSLTTLEKIAACAQVPLEHVLFGTEAPVSRPIAREVDEHPSAAFGPGARAFLELHSFSAEAVAVVRALMAVSFNPAHRWSAEEWFDELRAEHTRRARGLKQRSA